jgi:hypothetical protein
MELGMQANDSSLEVCTDQATRAYSIIPYRQGVEIGHGRSRDRNGEWWSICDCRLGDPIFYYLPLQHQ